MKLAPPGPPRPAPGGGPPGEGAPPGMAAGPGAGVWANVEAAKAPIPPAMMNSRRFNLHLNRGPALYVDFRCAATKTIT